MERFATLPARVQQLHQVGSSQPRIWEGFAQVQRGHGWVANLLNTLLRLPKAREYTPLRVTLRYLRGGESWERDFDGQCFHSYQYVSGQQLCERVGLVRLLFATTADQHGLTLRLAGLRLPGITLPKCLTPRIDASETEGADGALRFSVRVALWPGQLLIAYRGELQPADFKSR